MYRPPKTLVYALLIIGLLLAACAPAAAPAPSPTTPPAAPPTKAAEPAKTSEPAKPLAPTATAQPATPTPKPVSLKFGSSPSASDAGVFMAAEKGYFKEQGITMEMVGFRTVAEMIAPLGTGQLDVMGMPLSTALLAAADRGVELKLVADKGQSMPKWEYNWIVLRKDLADSGRVKTPADLKGMKVAVPSPGSQGELAIQVMAERAGLKPNDIEIVVLPFAEQATALGNKAIAASHSIEPYIATGVQEGYSIKWIPNSQLYGGKVQIGNVVYGPTMLKDQDLGRRWMVAYLKGIRDYLKAFSSGQGRDQVVASLVKYTPVKEAKLYDIMEMPYLDPNGLTDKPSSDVQYKWYVDKGLYTGKKTFDDILDRSFADYATQKLGKQ